MHEVDAYLLLPHMDAYLLHPKVDGYFLWSVKRMLASYAPRSGSLLFCKAEIYFLRPAGQTLISFVD